MTIIKFCGITNLEDALDAVKFGVDALGFVFAMSPRKVTADMVKKIITNLPPYVLTVGVFVNEKIDIVKTTVESCGIDWVQLHGDESPEYCSNLNLKCIKVIKNNIDIIPQYKTDYVLLDALSPVRLGGTGTLYDWDLAVRAKMFGKKIILAGGLNPENVCDAIRKVNPYAVDVSSGIEKEPGKKDYNKMRDFIYNIKSLNTNDSEGGLNNATFKK